MNRSSIVDGILVAVGVYLLIQAISFMHIIVESSLGGDLMLIMTAFIPVLFGTGGAGCLMLVRSRRKKRMEHAPRVTHGQRTTKGISVIAVHKPRPMMVTVLAIFFAATGASGLYAGIFASGGFDALFDILPAGLIPVYSITVIAAGIASGAAAYGMFKRKRLSWTLGILVAFFGIGASTVEVVLRLSDPVSGVAGIVLGMIILYCLYRHEVKAYFGRVPAAAF